MNELDGLKIVIQIVLRDANLEKQKQSDILDYLRNVRFDIEEKQRINKKNEKL